MAHCGYLTVSQFILIPVRGKGVKNASLRTCFQSSHGVSADLTLAFAWVQRATGSEEKGMRWPLKPTPSALREDGKRKTGQERRAGGSARSSLRMAYLNVGQSSQARKLFFTQAVSLGSSLFILTGFTVDTHGLYLRIFSFVLSQLHTCVLCILIHIYEYMYSPHCLFLPTLCLPLKSFSVTKILFYFFSVAKRQFLTLGDLHIILRC